MSKLTGFIIVLIVICWFILTLALFTVTKKINEVGLKSVIERIWDGPRKDNK